MRTLDALQAGFLQALTGATPPLLGASRLDAEQSWAIYRRNYRENHIAALAETYGAVHTLVGEAYFRQLARRYLAAHSSQSGDLNDYGEHFGDFLAACLPTAPGGAELSYLPDVARLDWAWFAVLRAPSAPEQALAGLLSWAADQQGDVRARPHPACRLLRSDYPLYRLWCLAEGSASAVDLGAGPEAVLISRPGGRVAVSLLAPAEAVLLQMWFAGRPLRAALAAAVTHTLALDIAACFTRLNTLAVVGELWSPS